MLITCVSLTVANELLPNRVFNYSEDIALGKTYTVYGSYLADCKIEYLIVGKDSTRPRWVPSELFVVKDGRLSRYWQFTVNTSPLPNTIDYVWGYEELINESDHFDRLADLDPTAIDLFNKYKLIMDLEFPDSMNPLLAKSLEINNWVLCPVCADGSQANPRDAMFRCPVCLTISHNSLYSR